MRKRTTKTDSSGAYTVEFALLFAFVLLPLLLGIVNFGMMFMRRGWIDDAAREGARAGGMFSNAGQAQTSAAQRTRDYLIQMGVNPSDFSVATSVGGSPPTVRVNVTYNNTMIAQDLLDFGGDGSFLRDLNTLRGQAEMALQP